MSQTGPSLPAFALFAAILSASGLPIYIHAQAVYSIDYGVGLTELGWVLFGLRLFDVVQDPAFGWLAHKTQGMRRLTVLMGGSVMALSMLGLFAVTPPIAPLAWFALTLTGLFSSFSFLYICFYAEGVEAGRRLPGKGHLRLAGWRETGALLGICLAAVSPSLLAGTAAPFAWFAIGFAAVTGFALWAMQRQWSGASQEAESGQFRLVLSDPIARRLLLIAFANAAPVAVSSTLFVFFVNNRLEAPGWDGPLLLVFFLAAAASSPVWSRFAQRIGARRALALGMALAIAAFSVVPFLGPGDAMIFAAICLMSGITVGADLTLLPALFASRMAEIAPNASAGFGLWAFMSKFTLAFAAVVLLSSLESAGFVADGDSTEFSLNLLAWLYAGIPCMLKLVALALLLSTKLPEPTAEPAG